MCRERACGKNIKMKAPRMRRKKFVGAFFVVRVCAESAIERASKQAEID